VARGLIGKPADDRFERPIQSGAQVRQTENSVRCPQRLPPQRPQFARIDGSTSASRRDDPARAAENLLNSRCSC